jgi:putative hydrolase of the HAD superfamily
MKSTASGLATVAAVTLDVTHTLVHPPRLGSIYAEVLARHGVAVSGEDVRRVAPVVWQELACSVPLGACRFAAHDGGERGFWRHYLERLCALLEVGAPSRFAAAELYERFGRAEAWEIYPDVVPTLTAFADAGVALAIVSNWDGRLPLLLERLGLLPFFDAVVHSSAVGSEKPSPAIFREALRRLALAPERVLHVGDHRREDVEGARAVGMQALHLDRAGAGDVASLADVPELLAPLSLAPGVR